MQKANQILKALRKLGEKGLPLTRIYRNLYCQELFLVAYNKIGRKQGSLTPGVDNDTADGMSLSSIANLIELLRDERFNFRAARRIYIPKKSGGKRALGLPNFSDKLVQEVLRMMLEAYYEPQFKDSSHGYRPNRGCHTALRRLKESFQGSAWLIEGDIKGCFDSIDHEILMAILAQKIKDGRLLDLIRRSLKAGVMDGWQYHKTYSGTPQGSVLSPLLANIYLHELDTFIEEVLIPQYTSGKGRAHNLVYKRYEYRIKRARERGDHEMAEKLRQERRQHPSRNMYDANFRRLRYLRYADDFILGFIGSKSEAKQIKISIGAFLQDWLKLEMSASKTLITHARTEKAHFLSYDISIYQNNDALSRTTGDDRKNMRSINGHIRLGVPYGLTTELAKRYQRNGKVISEAALLAFSDAHIIDVYQKRFRGLAEYYKYAVDRCHLSNLKYVMEIALVKTLAHKYRITVSQVYRKYHGRQIVSGVEYKTLEVKVPTERGERLFYWGAIPLRVVKLFSQPMNDTRYSSFRMGARSDLIERLQANKCELCGSKEDCEVHHVRKLADLKKPGRKEKPDWMKRMIAMQRKTLIVCRKCHIDIHAGRPTEKTRS